MLGKTSALPEREKVGIEVLSVCVWYLVCDQSSMVRVGVPRGEVLASVSSLLQNLRYGTVRNISIGY